MNPNPQVCGVTEECHSSESGWTMYIGSPFYGDDDNEHSVDNDGANIDDNGGDDDDDDDDDDDKGKGYNQEDDSDDSMASDASSGPSHQGTGSLKHKAYENKQGNGGGSEEASKPSMERQRVDVEKKKKKKENDVLMDGQTRGNTSSSFSLSGHQSGSMKVRKNSCFLSGKRK